MYLLVDTRTTARWKLDEVNSCYVAILLVPENLLPWNVYEEVLPIFTRQRKYIKIGLNHSKEQSRGYSWGKEKGKACTTRSASFHLPVSCTLEISRQRLNQEDAQILLWNSWGPADLPPQWVSLLVHSSALCGINSSRLMMSCHSERDEHLNNLT